MFKKLLPIIIFIPFTFEFNRFKSYTPLFLRVATFDAPTEFTNYNHVLPPNAPIYAINVYRYCFYLSINRILKNPWIKPFQ